MLHVLFKHIIFSMLSFSLERSRSTILLIVKEFHTRNQTRSQWVTSVKCTGVLTSNFNM